MNLNHNSIFDEDFSKIEGIRSFPYVGNTYQANCKRILVFAHNIYCQPDKYEGERERTKAKLHYANSIFDYTYCNEKWTYTFRNFIKASVGLRRNYSKESPGEILQNINSFVSSISYTNYINDLVPSVKANNVLISRNLIEASNEINLKLIKTLNVSHIVCWGKNVFNYILQNPKIKVLQNTADFTTMGALENKTGFGFAKVTFDGQTILLLKTFHPSMPGFGTYKTTTQDILRWFYDQ